MTDLYRNTGDPERNIFFEMTADALTPHPSGECRCNLPGSSIACTLPVLHDGGHEAPPIKLTTGEMSNPIRWEQNRPVEP